MRIVIDLQAVQSAADTHGAAIQLRTFLEALVANEADCEPVLALNGALPDSIDVIRLAVADLVPPARVRVWQAVGPVRMRHGDPCAPLVNEVLREAFLASLSPDIVYLHDLYAGNAQEMVLSVNRFSRDTPVTLSMLTPPSLPDLAVTLSSRVAGARALIACGGPQARLPDGWPDSEEVQWLREPEGAPVDVAALSRALAATWRRLAGLRRDPVPVAALVPRKPRLAYVSPLPPSKTGIASYSVDLLQALSPYYDIELIALEEQAPVLPTSASWSVRDVDWLRAHHRSVDRVIYHLGNSPFHSAMLPLITAIPGLLVLHDFYLGHLLAWQDRHAEPGAWDRALYASHGYHAVVQRQVDTQGAMYDFPSSFPLVAGSRGVVVHSQHARALASRWYGDEVAGGWSVVPLLYRGGPVEDSASAKARLGFKAGDFVVCSFGFLGETKLSERLMRCWLASSLARDKSCHLVFVGEGGDGPYGRRIDHWVRTEGKGARVAVTGFVSAEVYRRYLSAADMAVQLRAMSRGESSATVLDCMGQGRAVVVNANGAMAELDPEAVWMISDHFDDAELVRALDTLYQDPERRAALGHKARAHVQRHHAAELVATAYRDAVEQAYSVPAPHLFDVIDALVPGWDTATPAEALLVLAEKMAQALPAPRPARRLYVDVSIVAKDDIKTGIQRVVRALTQALLQNPPPGYRVEPVSLSDAGGVWHYRLAPTYALALLGGQRSDPTDDAGIDVQHGDVVLALDFAGSMLTQAAAQGLFRRIRDQGGRCHGVVYDLLPVLMPDVFPPGAADEHFKWLQVIGSLDGAICISHAVADDLRDWRAEHVSPLGRARPYAIEAFHLGADVQNSVPSRGLPADAPDTLRALAARPTFLMVGTIEPRKGYLQVLEAFDHLWAQGMDINLVVVGKEGWKGLSPDSARRNIPETLRRLTGHVQLDRRLFWLEAISDEYLDQVYAASTCLVAASYGEGFGLPLVEAARHGLPIIARDIPVFREVAGVHAFYFEGLSPTDLSRAIEVWLGCFDKGDHPTTDGMRWMTWSESAGSLLQALALETPVPACVP